MKMKMKNITQEIIFFGICIAITVLVIGSIMFISSRLQGMAEESLQNAKYQVGQSVSSCLDDNYKFVVLNVIGMPSGTPDYHIVGSDLTKLTVDEEVLCE